MHVHHWQIKYDDIDGGCIVVYAVCECGARLERKEIEQALNILEDSKLDKD